MRRRAGSAHRAAAPAPPAGGGRAGPPQCSPAPRPPPSANPAGRAARRAVTWGRARPSVRPLGAGGEGPRVRPPLRGARAGRCGGQAGPGRAAVAAAAAHPAVSRTGTPGTAGLAARSRCNGRRCGPRTPRSASHTRPPVSFTREGADPAPVMLVSRRVKRFLQLVPGKQRFGVYRFLPFFFLLGGAMEWFMINVRIGKETFCKCGRRPVPAATPLPRGVPQRPRARAAAVCRSTC